MDDWTFESTELANHFDSHLHEQLPWVDQCYDLLWHVARHFLGQDSVMYDIGASTGNVTRRLSDIIEQRDVKAFAIENSSAMVQKWNGGKSVTLISRDAMDVDYEPFDFGVIFLTLMFLPPKEQKPFVERLFEKLNPGGAIFVLDKTFCNNGYVNVILQRYILLQKLKGHALPSAILEKEFSLEGIQRPIKPDIVFSQVPHVQIFQVGSFSAWLITK